LVEKKVCFISYAGNWQGQWQTFFKGQRSPPMTSRW
jgi:hypothetical protein